MYNFFHILQMQGNAHRPIILATYSPIASIEPNNDHPYCIPATSAPEVLPDDPPLLPPPEAPPLALASLISLALAVAVPKLTVVGLGLFGSLFTVGLACKLLAAELKLVNTSFASGIVSSSNTSWIATEQLLRRRSARRLTLSSSLLRRMGERVERSERERLLKTAPQLMPRRKVRKCAYIMERWPPVKLE